MFRIQAQMAAKQQALVHEKDLATKEFLKASQAEEVYQQRMKDMIASTQPQVDFRRKKVDWYN